MSLGAEDIAYVRDLFSDIPDLTTRKMFGGLGIYADGTIFALLMSDGALMLKGAGNMPAQYSRDNWQPWTYTRKNGAKSSMPYWRVPDDLRDDPELMCDWARRALAEL